MNKILLLLMFLLAAACQRVSDTIEPKIDYAVQDTYLLQLPPPFPPLSLAEEQQNWGKEAIIGRGFARQLDLYQAITAFRRAQILLPEYDKERRLELDYEILLCYYLGKKFEDVIFTFEKSGLRSTPQDFPATRDLLVILYDSYRRLEREEQALKVLQYLYQCFPETAAKLALSTALLEGNLTDLQIYAKSEPPPQKIQPFLDQYYAEKKSVTAAQWSNALCPGAGYLYLGQKQSALTAFLLNGLFIAASYHFFHKGELAAGTIFASFEAGWYFGGIYGAGLEAKLYNERLYEREASLMMNRDGLFPVFMLQHAF